MNKRFLLGIVCCLLLPSFLFSQARGYKPYNAGFERMQGKIPTGWYLQGDSDKYTLTQDSLVFISGKYSLGIDLLKENTSVILAQQILPKYTGKKITLKGYIKTENLEGAGAGLWLRIDPQLEFDNMNDRPVKGTTGWQEYEITLPYDPEKMTGVAFGALLRGRGKVWVDDLRMLIDGVPVELLTPALTKAEKDTIAAGGSGIDFIPGDAKTVENLKLLGMIWGFVKYYHPNVAAGEFNMDAELFRLLPGYLKVRDNRERDRYLSDWLESLGSYRKNTGKNDLSKLTVKFLPDLEWINLLSGPLATKLNAVKDAYRSGKNQYISLTPNVLNPVFKENKYENIQDTDAGFRLLSLYRYWNMIQYFFPYKNLIGEDWKDVLPEFIPLFLESKNKRAYTLTALKLIGRIHDTHANIYGNPEIENFFGTRTAPLEITFAEGNAVITGIYDKKLKDAGIKTGDVVSQVNDKPVNKIVARWLAITPASNYPTQLRNVASNLLRSNEPRIKVFIKDRGEKIIETIPQQSFYKLVRAAQDTVAFKLLTGNIGYIHNGLLKRKDLPAIWNALKNTRGLVIDNRNYPSDFPIYDLCRYLAGSPRPFVRFSSVQLKDPGLFALRGSMNVGTDNPESYKGKIVILVNETSQSSSEFHAMAYRALDNAIVLGSTTAGADGNVSPIYLPGGIFTYISGIGIYDPHGGETQRVGIVPDIEIKPTLKGIKEGRDEVLERAIEILAQ